MKHLLKITLVLTVFQYSFFSHPALAQLPSLGGVQQMAPGAEYFAGRIEGKSLIKVNLVSGVRTPGVYYIPEDTNLAELLSYAGGAIDGAKLEDVRVRSILGGKWQFRSYDFLSISQDLNDYPKMNQGDIIQIDVAKDQLSRTALWISVISAITSLSLAIMNQTNK